MTEARRIEGPRNRLIAEWDKDTGEMTRCEFVDPEDDGIEDASKDHTIAQAEPTNRGVDQGPPKESEDPTLRVMATEYAIGGLSGHVWGD